MESFSKKREAAIAAAEKRLFEIHSRFPETALTDKKLSATSARLLQAAMSEEPEKEFEKIKEETSRLREERAKILESGGYPADYTNVKFECTECCDTGFVGLEMCRCLKKAVTLAALEDSGVGALVKKQSFETFRFDFYEGDGLKYARANFDVLKKFAENFGKDTSENFILMGDTGLGKTHLSTSVAKVVIEKGYRVAYDTASDIMGDFEAERFKGTVTDGEIKHRYYDSDLLIIDDLGCEVSNQFTVSCVYNLINNRITNGRATLINTNLTQRELREKYADRIVSRILGEYRPLLFTGKDIRAQKLSGK